MTSIASPLPVASSLPVTPVAAPVVATVENPAITLLTSVLNQPLNGTVQPATTPGTLTLATDLGTLQLQTAAVLQAGLEVIAQALPGQTTATTSLSVRLLDAQGRPLVAPVSVPPLGNGQTAAASPAPSLAAIEDSVSVSAAGRSEPLEASVLRGPDAGPTAGIFGPGEMLPPLPAGTLLSVRLVSLTVPGAIVEPDASPAAAPTVSMAPHPEAPAEAATATEPPGLPTPQRGDHLSLAGTVAGNTLAGQPILRTDRGLLAVATGTDLPAGARVTLDAIVTALPSPVPVPGPAPMISGPFPALAQLISHLVTQAPETAAAVLAQLPSDNRQLLATAATALSAASTPAGVQEWLTAAATLPAPETGAPLKPGSDGALAAALAAPSSEAHRSLIERAVSELMPPAIPLRDASGDDWQMRTLPFLIPPQGLERATVLTRRTPETDEDAADGRKRQGRGYRLLVNLDLSRLGPVQIDGLFVGEDRRLDMVVRSDRPLTPEIRHGLLATFVTTTEALSLIGGVVFRSGDPFAGPAISRPSAAVSGWVA